MTKIAESSGGFVSATILFCSILVILLGTAGYLGYKERQLKGSTLGIKSTISSTPTSTTTSTSTSTTTSTPKPYDDSDPIVNCGPGVNSKQYVKDRASNCKNYVDCGLNNNTMWSLMLKTECNKKHEESQLTNNKDTTNNYPPCTVCWQYAGCLTYTFISPEECKIRQEKAKTSSISNPIPSITPYNTPQPTPVPLPTHNQAAIERCKSDVREETTNLINGCYIKYQGSAADACARGVQGQQASKMVACENL